MTSSVSPPPARSVLIVEDEAMIALMLEEFVGALGHRVHGVANTLEDACRIVRSGGFDLAILDCHLNGEEAWPVADMLEQSQIPYVLSSGGSSSDIPAPYAGRPLLAKPYTLGTISDVLGTCIGTPT
ncbi:MAG TPA: response regulator [Sphingobium sp.]|jgi:CheY-like chemotaxis protein|nr:response regulator [Sphingobium sp.]